MTLTVKLTLIVTFNLKHHSSISGYYLIGEEKLKSATKKAIGVNIFFYIWRFCNCRYYDALAVLLRLLMQLQLLLLPPQDLDISPPLSLPV
mgnify:CR=1 FL=1